jgi:hypothetical protein
MRCARQERLLRTISQESGNYLGVAMACCANLGCLLLVLVSGSIDVGPVAGIAPGLHGGTASVHTTRVVVATPSRPESVGDRIALLVTPGTGTNRRSIAFTARA